MSYKISAGIAESELPAWLADAANKYGTFADGRVNYKDAPIAPVVMCTLMCQNEILIVKRGYGLADAEGYWSTVNGFIDQPKSVAEQAAQEFAEEISLKLNPTQIKVAPSYTIKGSAEKRSYIVFPCLAVISIKPDVKLDHEHTDFAWIDRKKLENYHILDDLPKVIDAALHLLDSAPPLDKTKH